MCHLCYYWPTILTMVPWCLESESPAWALEKLSIPSASLLSPLLVNINPPPSQRQELCRQTHTQHTDTHTHLCSWMNQRQYIGRCHSQKKKLPWFPRRLCVFNKMRTKHRTLRKDLAYPLLKTTSDHKGSPICYSASVLAFLSFLPFFCYPPPQDRVSLYSLVGLKLTR